MRTLSMFLKDSATAARVKLPTFIVEHRLTLSPAELEHVVAEGALSPPGSACDELEIGGQCVARGDLVRKRGRYYFKVKEIAPLEPAHGGEDGRT